jgi:hypothetical protein
MLFQETGSGEGLDLIDLDHDRYRWKALVNTVTNFQVL